jgi:uncharacterized membrane protein YcjF (UPF0283 family)
MINRRRRNKMEKNKIIDGNIERTKSTRLFSNKAIRFFDIVVAIVVGFGTSGLLMMFFAAISKSYVAWGVCAVLLILFMISLMVLIGYCLYIEEKKK